MVGAEDTLFALSLDGPTRGRMATLATVALIAVVALGVARARLPMSGPTWRILHGFLAVLVIGLGFGHAILTDGALDGFGTAVLLAFATVALLGVVAAYALGPGGREIALAAAPAALRGSRHERGDARRNPSSGARLLLAGGVGAAIALSLGIYGNAHAPATDLSITLGFTDTITMKVWLATVAVLLALVQLGSALWLYGRLPLRGAAAVARQPAPHLGPPRLPASSLPVAYHCLYQLAFQDTTRACSCTRCSAARSTARSRRRW